MLRATDSLGPPSVSLCFGMGGVAESERSEVVLLKRGCLINPNSLPSTSSFVKRTNNYFYLIGVLRTNRVNP